jgi:AcrR family transcriptional regulator
MSGAETREQVLAVSARLFAARGIAGTTMRAIAEECSIKAASLYSHFASKDEIVAEVLRRSSVLAERLFDEVRTSRLPPGPRLEALMRATLQSFRAHPEASRTFFENPEYVASSPLLHSVRAGAKAIDTLWASALADADRSGLLRAGLDPVRLWPLLRSMMLAAAQVPPQGALHGDAVVTLLLHGVLATPPDAAAPTRT